MSADPVGPDDQSGITIKGGSDFSAPWFTPRGTLDSQLRQVKAFFGLTDEETEGKAPFEIVVLAASKFQLAWSGKLVESGLGGQQQNRGNSGGGNRGGRPNVGGGGGGRATATEKKAESTPEEDMEAGVLSALEEAADIDALKQVYVRNKDAFETEQKSGKTTLRDALKARKAALKVSAEKGE